ncbi:MAG: metallophosphoesterase [Candidatus Omnitrophota bacterium]
MIQRRNKAILTGVFALIVWVCGVNYSHAATPAKFNFIVSGDTINPKVDSEGVNVLQSICDQIRGMSISPKLFLIPGDIGAVSLLKEYMGSLYDITFPIRGNHDTAVDYDQSLRWTPAEIKARVKAIGGKNYSTLPQEEGLTYSFDYQNAHFVGLDSISKTTMNLTAAQLDWLDKDLEAAEKRILTHAFIQTHVPLIGCSRDYVTGVPSYLIPIINKHKIISLWLGGHTHVFAWTHINKQRVSGLTNEVESFNVGPLSQGGRSGPWILDGTYDYGDTNKKYGFAVIKVDGLSVTVEWYNRENTALIWSKTFIPRGNFQTGDVKNSDHVINSYDALLVARHAAGQITLTYNELVRGDVNYDRKITKDDADLITQYVVGLISKF